MAGLCEGGNEPPGFLKARFQLCSPARKVVDLVICSIREFDSATSTWVNSEKSWEEVAKNWERWPIFSEQPPTWLSPLRRLPSDAKLRSGVVRFPLKLIIWLGFFEIFLNRKVNVSEARSRLVPVAWQQWSEMEALIPSPAACEVRSVIKFFNAQRIAPIEIHRQLCQVYGPKIMSKQMVRRWCRQFSEGRQSVHDEERSGRPSLINDDRVELVRQCIMENHRFTITEPSSHFPHMSRSLLHEIVTKHLLFKKVYARWVPKNLTPEHKMQRLGAALTFLQRYHDDGDEFLDRIVTGDETWISHFTPETKQQSMHWRHSGSPVRTKFKHKLSVRKVMCTVFWARKGILLIGFLPRGETVNADHYCETLRKLQRAIQNKRRGMLTTGVVLLHDNARPHTARRTAAVLTEFGWELFDQPPYSPDLAPSDFHVFLHLKKFLSSGERFGNDEELKTSVTRWFHSQAAEFYDRGIQKLIPRYDKCLNSDGGYVEK
ncbi:hypothetical protein ANN_16885 [Periplaneta americana]|uniref:Mos1 transposase HTH domain-containing protein n=1 Tax=Periplaneta americana TaxID=6978 RepID=A0ABQ8SRC2_PERAM|nr:hypothetical protein ANN_16885 [Periplaneta americana]